MWKLSLATAQAQDAKVDAISTAMKLVVAGDGATMRFGNAVVNALVYALPFAAIGQAEIIRNDTPFSSVFLHHKLLQIAWRFSPLVGASASGASNVIDTPKPALALAPLQTRRRIISIEPEFPSSSLSSSSSLAPSTSLDKKTPELVAAKQCGCLPGLCGKCAVLFELNVHNDSLTETMAARANHMRNVQNAKFPLDAAELGLGLAHPEEALAVLGPQQRLEFRVWVRLHHGRVQISAADPDMPATYPVTTPFTRSIPRILVNPGKQIPSEHRLLAVQKCPTKVLGDSADPQKMQEAANRNAAQCVLCKDCCDGGVATLEDDEDSASVVTQFPSRTLIQFHTNGAYSAKEALRHALLHLRAQCVEVGLARPRLVLPCPSPA